MYAKRYCFMYVGRTVDCIERLQSIYGYVRTNYCNVSWVNSKKGEIEQEKALSVEKNSEGQTQNAFSSD